VVPKGFKLDLLKEKTLGGYLAWADVIVFQGFIMHNHPEIATCGKVLVADLYDPFHLENLEMFREEETERRLAMASIDLSIVNDQLKVCDFFVCASEKQRDFWLGQLAAVGRLNPLMYDMDPTLRSLIDIVPFGISSETPMHTAGVMKGVVDGIGKDDKVILWGGGIYNWFDPLTLIKAMGQLREDHPEVKLFFLGMAHPNPDVPEMRMATAAVGLARELGLENVNVFFNQGWVPYEQRASYLLESDIGVSCHLEHIETTYSYRTRVLDYFWAEMPVIVTRGDALSQLVHEKSLGLTVQPGDVEGFATAIRRMVEDENLARDCSLNVGKLRPELSWSHVIEPLDRFCRQPKLSADKFPAGSVSGPGGTALRRIAGSVKRTLDEGGPTLVARRTAHYLNKKLKSR
ncbi:MAG: glycosyltransferase family 4 protein, partial [Actinomycetota bacterium]